MPRQRETLHCHVTSLFARALWNRTLYRVHFTSHLTNVLNHLISGRKYLIWLANFWFAKMARRPIPDYYRHHVSPPFAKTYYPTAEEFSDPFTYVDSIQHDGRNYGVIKIVPPKGFRPPFALARNLEFRPRSQRLCMTDVFTKEHHILFDKMRSFYEGDVQKRRIPMFDGKILNFSFYLKVCRYKYIYTYMYNFLI